ncbi:MAG: hypothetical protein C5B58_12405 [Acidobacteria bacterium]|nr:MAG: hypothetical protein C5B58_12405 [Acidobacteriota bacterium]
MAGAWESTELSALVPPVQLDARVVYFPVRHHSPACAWHLRQLLRELKPAAVLIEGPRDASPLIPLVCDPELRTPVAIYTTYVRRRGDSLPQRHAAYYPLCDFSPELVAIRTGLEIGASVRFIDLTFPEHVEAGDQNPPADSPHSRRGPQSLQDESWFSHSRLLQAACVRTGTRDPDDLWDHLFELDYRHRSTASFVQNVLMYCSLARRDNWQSTMAGAACLAREQAMAAAVAEETGPTVVVTGGFHTVALPTTQAALPTPQRLEAEDHQVVLARYSFEQLDRLNGYASGMPSPEFYQREWEDDDPAQILVEVARRCRQRNLGTSTADAICAVGHSLRLAGLRGHVRASREDVLDGVRSTFVKGAIDAEGVAVLAIARKLLAGDRVGNVPVAAGQPPLVHDFRNSATELRLKLDKIDETEVVLDLYRRTTHRTTSRFFHRLALLEVPFATFVRGPDFVAGEKLERIQEVWTYHWSPQTESTLIERSLYGSTVEEAATGRLLELFQEEEQKGQGRSAAVATKLVLHACRMGLHAHTQDLLRRVGGLLAEDPSFVSLVEAMENLLVLDVSREPLEAHHLSGLHELATAAYLRACFLIPSLVSLPAEEEGPALNALNALFQAVRSLGDNEDLRRLRTQALTALAATSGGSAALRGGAVGLLFGDGNLAHEELVRHLRGHLLSSREDGADGPNFLRGLMKTARSALWQIVEVLSEIDGTLQDWDEERFVKMLPLLRLALSELTPRETDAVAKQVATLHGAESLKVAHLPDVRSDEMLRAVELDHELRTVLAADGLEVLCE